MKIKIKDFSKFVRSVIILLAIILFISFIVSNSTLSHGEFKYKKIYISNGDTIWNIAKEETNINEYYSNKDIRDIICDIKEINHLENSDLRIGQELIIPTI